MADGDSEHAEALSDREPPLGTSGDSVDLAMGVSAAASSASSGAAAKSITSQIDALRAEPAALIMNKKRVKEELRNAARKRTCLKSQAKLLSDDDLVQVLRPREENQNHAGVTFWTP